MTAAGARLIAAMKEVHAIARGEAEPYRIYEPQAEVTPPSVQSQGFSASPGENFDTSFAGTEGDEGQHPHSRSGGALDAHLPPKQEIAGSTPAQITNPACLTSRQADEGSSNPQHPRAAPLYTSPEAPFHSITDWEDEDQ